MNLRRLRGYETNEPSPLLHYASVSMLLAVKHNELTVLMGDMVVVRWRDGKRWPWRGGRKDKRAASDSHCRAEVRGEPARPSRDPVIRTRESRCPVT